MGYSFIGDCVNSFEHSFLTYMGEMIMSLTLTSNVSSADNGTFTLGASPAVSAFVRFAAVEMKAGLI